jgi:hypothetical protein
MLAAAFFLFLAPMDGSVSCGFTAATCAEFMQQVDRACTAKDRGELLHLVTHGPPCPEAKHRANECYDELASIGGDGDIGQGFGDTMDAVIEPLKD